MSGSVCFVNHVHPRVTEGKNLVGTSGGLGEVWGVMFERAWRRLLGHAWRYFQVDLGRFRGGFYKENETEQRT